MTALTLVDAQQRRREPRVFLGRVVNVGGQPQVEAASCAQLHLDALVVEERFAQDLRFFAGGSKTKGKRTVAIVLTIVRVQQASARLFRYPMSAREHRRSRVGKHVIKTEFWSMRTPSGAARCAVASRVPTQSNAAGKPCSYPRERNGWLHVRLMRGARHKNADERGANAHLCKLPT